MSLIQNARKPTLSAVRSCSRVRYSSNAASEPKSGSSFYASLFTRMKDNAVSNTYRGVEVQNIKTPKLNVGDPDIWKSNAIKLDDSMNVPYRSRPRPPRQTAADGQTTDPGAAARIMSRQPNPFPARAQRDSERRVQRDGEPRSQRSDESRPQRTGEPRSQRDGETRAARYNGESRPQRDREPRAPRDGQRQAGQRDGQRQTGPRDGERRDRREGSLNDRVKQAGSDKINQTGAGGRERADNASAESARDRPAKTVHQAPPALRMSSFRTAQFGNVFSQPPADTPATREAEVLRALEVPKENNETLVVKPRKKDVRVEKGVRKVKKRIVMRGSKRVVVDPRIRPVLERYGGDYSRLAPRSAISALHKPKQPLAYARAALTLRPYLSKARRDQALEVVEKFVREARAVA